MTDIKDFTNNEDLPKIDMTIKWKFHEDRPPRRRITSVDHPASRQESHSQLESSQVTRQNSRQDDSSSRKKLKLASQVNKSPLPSRRNSDYSMDTTL